jgi:hypothetical protein
MPTYGWRSRLQSKKLTLFIVGGFVPPSLMVYAPLVTNHRLLGLLARWLAWPDHR